MERLKKKLVEDFKIKDLKFQPAKTKVVNREQLHIGFVKLCGLKGFYKTRRFLTPHPQRYIMTIRQLSQLLIIQFFMIK
jgi:hypothetical protein